MSPVIHVTPPLVVDGVEIVKHKYLDWQKEVRRAVKEEFAKIIWLPTAARAGKDRLSAMLTVETSITLALDRLEYQAEHGPLGLVPLVNVWIVAPTKPLFKQCWEELMEYIPKHLIIRSARQEGQIVLKGGIHYSFKSADNPETLVSEGVDILWLTEASRMRSELIWFESLIPRLASPGRLGLAFINGSPRNNKRHWFRRSCDNAHRIIREANQESIEREEKVWPRERVWQLPMSVNPLMIDKMPMLKESMPARLYDSECLGLWPDDDAKPFRYDDVEALFVAGGSKPEGPFKTAIDVARFSNWTFATRWAIGRMHDDGTVGKPQLVAAMGLRNMRTHQQILRLEEFCREGPGDIMVDCTGAHGATFQEELERKLNQPIQGYDFHGSRKEVMIESFILAVEKGSFEIREDLIDEKWIKEMRDEFDGYECEINDNGTVDYHGEPDDFVTSGGLGWYMCLHGFGVSSFNMADYQKSFF